MSVLSWEDSVTELRFNGLAMDILGVGIFEIEIDVGFRPTNIQVTCFTCVSKLYLCISNASSRLGEINT